MRAITMEPQIAFRNLEQKDLRLLHQWLNEIVLGLLGANAYVSGPAVENAKSIRTLERAGFMILRTVSREDGMSSNA